jgi:hypothetical protein
MPHSPATLQGVSATGFDPCGHSNAFQPSMPTTRNRSRAASGDRILALFFAVMNVSRPSPGVSRSYFPVSGPHHQTHE